jgi:hypothetical protein
MIGPMAEYAFIYEVLAVLEQSKYKRRESG